jgi:hypothetical protein
VKHRVNTPLGWEFELHDDWRDDFGDLERSMALWGQFSGSIWQWEVLPFEPDWLPDRPFRWWWHGFVCDFIEGVNG